MSRIESHTCSKESSLCYSLPWYFLNCFFSSRRSVKSTILNANYFFCQLCIRSSWVKLNCLLLYCPLVAIYFCYCFSSLSGLFGYFQGSELCNTIKDESLTFSGQALFWYRKGGISHPPVSSPPPIILIPIKTNTKLIIRTYVHRYTLTIFQRRKI